MVQQVFPVQESAQAARVRASSGFPDVVELDAKELQLVFERQTGFGMAWDPARLKALARATRGGEPLDSMPRVLVENGQIFVHDGRHRIALAAKRGQRIQVGVERGQAPEVLRVIKGEVARARREVSLQAIKSIGKVRASEQEIRKLINFYRDSALKIRDKFAAALIEERPRLFSQLKDSLDILQSMDDRAETWASRNLGRLYEQAWKGSQEDLAALGLDERAVADAAKWGAVNKAAVESLLYDPQVGFVSSLANATQEIRDRLNSIYDKAKVLKAEQSAMSETIARTGILEGQSVNVVRDQIVKNLENLTTVTYQTATGPRAVDVQDYAEMLVRTKSSQATGLARRNRLLENGQALVQISKNVALDDDACNLYVGRVFALTKQAAEAYDVPHVSELPGGGCPLHPNCRHEEEVFMPQYEEDESKAVAFTRPPAWALNKSWGEISRQYRKQGGNKYGRKQNPNVKTAHRGGGRERHDAEKARNRGAA